MKPMTLSESPELLKKFRNTPWKFQQTFITPEKNLETFVAEIVSANSCESGCLTIDQIIFEPKNLVSLFKSHSIPPQYGHGWSITAEGPAEIEAVLYAALRDWVDFTFVPKPSPFGIFADHDEYTTFYSHTRANLNRVVEALSLRGFTPVPDYKRPRPRR
jgi:hypothetical protein